MLSAFRLAISLTAFLTICPIASSAAPISLETFAEKPVIGRPKISPDGKLLATPRSSKSGDAVVIHHVDDLAGVSASVIKLPTFMNVTWVEWANDKRLLVAMTKGEVTRVVAIDADGNNEVLLFAKDHRVRHNRDLSKIVHQLPNDPNAVLMGAYDGGGRYSLYKVDVNDGTGSLVVRGSHFTFQWLTDLQGVPRVRWDYRDQRDEVEIYVRVGETDDWEQVTKYGDRDLPDLNIVGFADDPRIAIVASRQFGDRYALYEYDTTTRKIGKLLFAHPRVDVGEPVGGPIYDPDSTKLLGVYFVDDLWETYYFDPTMASIQAALDAAFPSAAVIRPYAWSADLTRILVRVSGPKDPGSYHLLDTRKRHASLIGRTHPDIRSTELGEMLMIKHRARDGSKIPGYLTMPPRKGDKKLPMVVMPHGGPEQRDYVQYDEWAQMLATRGYVVFQPNFRGSGGYGKAFAEAGHRQWGRLMQDDVTDGVKALIADGTADPARICIVGASYGGYAALAGGAFTPDLYKCVISIAGVSDIPAMIEEEEDRFGDESAVYQYWVKRLGDPKIDQAQMQAVSPALHADRFKVPVLLIHGDADKIVPIDQSERMNDALKKAGKQVEFVKIAGEGHQFAKTESDIKVMSELERFLNAYIGK